MPGNDMAIFLKRLLTLCPAFAEVSMNMMFNFVALAVASSSVTCLPDEEQITCHWAVKCGKKRKEERGKSKRIPFIREIRLIPH
jgi:hypothetical protein